jgi:two-component sensor histidine kinase
VLPVPDTIGADSLGQDRDGNLWIGSGGNGIIKIANSGFTSFPLFAKSLFSSSLGTCVRRGDLGPLFLGCLDGDRFQWVEPQQPKYVGWGGLQLDFQDHSGEWWIATGEGLYRFPRVARFEQLGHIPPKAIYQQKDGLPGDDIFRLFEDSRGDVWIAVVGSRPPNRPLAETGVVRWVRASDTIQRFPEMGDFRWGLTRAFAEDQLGDIWIGTGERLVRYRKGRFSSFGEADGLPGNSIESLHCDSGGRLWIGTFGGGLFRIDSPADDRLRLLRYSVRDGLSGNRISAIIEDRLGRIYVVTTRGVDRLELAGARLANIRHYTEEDGLPGPELEEAWSDRDGVLWFSGPQFLARLAPQPESPRDIPVIRISGLRINGAAYALSELGETEVKNLQLRPDQNSLQVDFATVSLSSGKSIRYQYKLEGSDGNWSRPTDQRNVNYASLRPGNYGFQVRALTVDGAVSLRPASVVFTIRPPVWHQWWFLSAAGIALSLLIYTVYRYRLAQVLAVERIRTRIATDLHDDIGSSLSQIAILSEVARRKIENVDAEAAEPLSDIATVSSELVDAMGDIVWSINPKHDHLSNLEHRIRRFATDVLTARGIDLEFRTTATQADLRIGTDIRRQVFLIFKEAVNNIARHSGASLVTVEFNVAQEYLVLQIKDNGTGFDPAGDAEGNGLVNIRKRASDLGGSAVFESFSDRGTTLALRVPLTYQRWGGRRIHK